MIWREHIKATHVYHFNVNVSNAMRVILSAREDGHWSFLSKGFWKDHFCNRAQLSEQKAERGREREGGGEELNFLAYWQHLNGFVNLCNVKWTFDLMKCSRFSCFILSKETGATSVGEWNESLVLSNELIKVELPLWKIWKADVSSVSPLSKWKMKGWRWKRQLSKSFTVVIRPLSSRLIKANCYAHVNMYDCFCLGYL